MSDHRFTPATTCDLFRIPLYQRLFEWDDEQVQQLLQDLYSSYKEPAQDPYYIGVLTVYREANTNRLSLVDGQQRFTVLTLIGIVLKWQHFLKAENGDLRLDFFARKSDQAYLKGKVNGEHVDVHHINTKMEKALELIERFFKENRDKENRGSFADFIFKKTTFFLSKLPESYTVQELNQYFEAMNEAGKALELHEILKVRMLAKLSDDQVKKRYTKIWNVVSEMDKCVYEQKSDETNLDYDRRIRAKIVEPEFEEVVEDSTKLDVDSGPKWKIGAIPAENKRPTSSQRDRSEKAIVSFSDFLLHVLWLFLEDDTNRTTEFFKRDQLLQTFTKYRLEANGNKDSEDRVRTFLDELLQYRLIFDHFIIRVNSIDGKTNNYSLNFYAEADSENLEAKRQLIQYQSMLYVSTTTHLWLTQLLKYLRTESSSVRSYSSLLAEIKKMDNDRLQSAVPELTYQSIDRYWFWRLDYFLWENRMRFFTDKNYLKVADGYIFKSNRSIEHVAPQNPKSESQKLLSEDLLHTFGNLAMISAGQNSSLRNESYEVKMAHVLSYINNSVGGTIESLKLLKIHALETWREKEVVKHHNEMIDVLIDSFPEEYDSVKKHLLTQKLEQNIN